MYGREVLKGSYFTKFLGECAFIKLNATVNMNKNVNNA